MVTALIFFIMLLAIIFAWYGKRPIALSLFAISFTFAILWLFHHMTDVIGLSL